MLRVEKTDLHGLVIIHPKVFNDQRGYFMETYNTREFEEAIGSGTRFVQDNESMSNAGVLRGLHYQEGEHVQGKLVRAMQGAVLDVCVDIRPSSPTYGAHYKKRLDAVDKCMLYVPPGFAHGILILEDRTIFTYKCTAYYAPQAERSILWNDPMLNIDWGITDPLLSDKDKAGIRFETLNNEASSR